MRRTLLSLPHPPTPYHLQPLPYTIPYTPFFFTCTLPTRNPFKDGQVEPGQDGRDRFQTALPFPPHPGLFGQFGNLPPHCLQDTACTACCHGWVELHLPHCHLLPLGRMPPPTIEPIYASPWGFLSLPATTCIPGLGRTYHSTSWLLTCSFLCCCCLLHYLSMPATWHLYTMPANNTMPFPKTCLSLSCFSIYLCLSAQHTNITATSSLPLYQDRAPVWAHDMGHWCLSTLLLFFFFLYTGHLSLPPSAYISMNTFLLLHYFFYFFSLPFCFFPVLSLSLLLLTITHTTHCSSPYIFGSDRDRMGLGFVALISPPPVLFYRLSHLPLPCLALCPILLPSSCALCACLSPLPPSLKRERETCPCCALLHALGVTYL